MTSYIPRTTFEGATTEEVTEWLRDAIVKLGRKAQRDRAYLDRRAARGTFTPTDEALEQDQFLLGEVILFLTEALEAAQTGGNES